MEVKIQRVRLVNFRIFRDQTFSPNPGMNIFVGDNATGKSSLLLAIDMALSGSISRVMAFGMENIMNAVAVSEWRKDPRLETLPKAFVELTFEMPDKPKYSDFFGQRHSRGNLGHEFGIKMMIEPNPDRAEELADALRNSNGATFPYSFYSVDFSTFADIRYNGFKKPCKSAFLDNSTVNTGRLFKKIVADTYQAALDDSSRASIEHKFSDNLSRFTLPEAATRQSLIVSGNLADFLDISENGVSFSNHGEGSVNLRKTESSLSGFSGNDAVFLVEEPENHLSPRGLKKVVSLIADKTKDCQVFIATHSSYIASRLGLKNVFFVGGKIDSLASISEDTADFFVKAPNDNLLQFILSRKVVLVEGAAEYILMDSFFRAVKGMSADECGVWILSINGLSFPRYFEIAQVLGTKVAAIRDNDGNPQDWYPEYAGAAIHAFSDDDRERKTFEVCLFRDNEPALRALFKSHGDPQKYMLGDKAEAACQILKSWQTMTVPAYIRAAIEWITA